MKYNKAFCIADLHTPYQNDDVISIAKQIIKDEKPTHLILLGDMFDCEHISKFTVKGIDSGLVSTLAEIKQFKKILNGLLKVCPKNIEVIYMLGNHEDRIPQVLGKFKTKGLIEKYDYWKEQMDLEEHFPMCKFYDYNDVYKLGKLSYTHGIYHSQFHAKAHAIALTTNIIYGHLHTDQVYTMHTMNKSYPRQAISMGCACKLNMSYLRGKPSSWINQVGIVNYRDKGEYTIVRPTIINSKTFHNGKVYKA